MCSTFFFIFPIVMNVIVVTGISDIIGALFLQHFSVAAATMCSTM